MIIKEKGEVVVTTIVALLILLYATAYFYTESLNIECKDDSDTKTAYKVHVNISFISTCRVIEPYFWNDSEGNRRVSSSECDVVKQICQIKENRLYRCLNHKWLDVDSVGKPEIIFCRNESD